MILTRSGGGSTCLVSRTLRSRDKLSVCRRKTSSAASFSPCRGTISVPSLLSDIGSSPSNLPQISESAAAAASFPAVWLRDSCQCALCVHATCQKLFKTSDISPQIKPLQLMNKLHGLEVVWEASAGQGEHTSFYSFDFLRRHASPGSLSAFHSEVPAQRWSSKRFSNLTDTDLSIDYSALTDPHTLYNAYSDLAKHGLIFIRNMPTAFAPNGECELRAFAQSFGVLRNTFYGETWNVKNVKNSKNIAYTNLDLGLHMDLLYFKEPPRYQILHCLRNKVEGGHSLFVDGFNAALEMYENSPDEFFCLADTKVSFHYINDGHHLHCSHPTFELDEASGNPSAMSVVRNERKHEISAINYSPPFQAPLLVGTPPSFYNALSKYTSILNRPENRFTYLLREGDAVIFDNRRVLHGRTAFTDRHGGSGELEGETNRWLKGCYLEEDAVLDKRRVLARNLQNRCM